MANRTGRAIWFEPRPQNQARREMREIMPSRSSTRSSASSDGDYDDGQVDPTLPRLLGDPPGLSPPGPPVTPPAFLDPQAKAGDQLDVYSVAYIGNHLPTPAVGQ